MLAAGDIFCQAGQDDFMTSNTNTNTNTNTKTEFLDILTYTCDLYHQQQTPVVL